MNKQQFSRPPLSHSSPPSNAPGATTPAKRSVLRFVEAATPPQSPTRIPAAAAPKAAATLGPKELQAEIVADYKKAHGPGAVPDLDHVFREIWKRLGLDSPSAKPSER